jgi:hypothetical protein
LSLRGPFVTLILVLVVVGFPLLYFLTPILRSRHWLVEGWWS